MCYKSFSSQELQRGLFLSFMKRQTHTTAIGADQTYDQVKASLIQFGNAEFVDSHGLYAGWGIKRSLAYNLMSTGEIKGVTLRRRGQTRGKRLFVTGLRPCLPQRANAGRWRYRIRQTS